MTRHSFTKQTGQGMNTQRGGTLLGLIIGALIGLAAALAVAVYITKVPVPFMNKSQSRSPDHDAAEAKKNRDWDPNAPLYGKNPAKPSAASGGPVIDVTPQKPAAAPVAPAEPAARTAKPAVDPIGDLAKARLAAPAAAPGADPFTYFVQVGAFRTPEDAEQQRAKISLMGLEARVTEREQSGRTVFRVRLGPFDKKDDADKAKERLDGSGIETALVRVQR
ncbi:MULTISPECIES: SPOR domain-containing protein [unclassified Polaromonas]|jgi:cell division protein FtsN|uniref:SPOR domain-containing protein n=2 Tax=unclassified Polaromonas TaxID=2638319 RepID=UPI0025E877C8|nr:MULTISPECIES: SPOR domain-containing protein [unclassified Polaromonas]HQS42554.1 SPOR domain-containing protein [Polaromonas sp.]HQS87067.1 SPOR domain-containing protein [Polaromonas sp.]